MHSSASVIPSSQLGWNRYLAILTVAWVLITAWLYVWALNDPDLSLEHTPRETADSVADALNQLLTAAAASALLGPVVLASVAVWHGLRRVALVYGVLVLLVGAPIALYTVRHLMA